MKRVVILAAAVAALCSCGNSEARKQAKREAEIADSLAKVEAAAAASAIDPKQEKKTVESLASLPEEPVFDIVTNMGTIKVKLYKDTPRHRDNFEKLAIAGYY